MVSFWFPATAKEAREEFHEQVARAIVTSSAKCIAQGRSEKEERVASWLFVPGRVFKGGRSGPGPLISSSILSNGSKLVTHCRLRFKWPEAIEEKTFQRLTVGVPLITATISRPRFLESFRSFPRTRNFYHFSLSMIFPSNFCISTPTPTSFSRIRNSIDANFLILFSIVFSEFYKFRPSIRDLYQISDFSRVPACFFSRIRNFDRFSNDNFNPLDD